MIVTRVFYTKNEFKTVLGYVSCTYLLHVKKRKKKQIRNSVLFDKLSHFLDSVVIDERELIIIGNSNFHLDNAQDPDAVKFLRI